MCKRKIKLMIPLLAGLLLTGAVSCQKKDEGDHTGTEHAGEMAKDHEMPAGHEMMGGGHEMMGGHGASKKKEVVVSDEVRAAWKEVTLAVTDKGSGETKTYKVKPESDFSIPDTGLQLKIGAYLPDFTMTPGEITSKSAEDNNPALQVAVTEGEEEKYSGWLFANFPDMHAFEHPKYGISLVSEIKAEGAAGGMAHPSM